MGTHVLTARAVLFDMDGTLVDSTAVVERVWGRFALRHGLALGAILETSHGRLMRDTVARWAPEGTDIDAECLDLYEFEMANTEGTVAVPGAEAFANSVPRDAVALVTSAGVRLARIRMDAAGIDFPAVAVTADDVEAGKPDPSGYLAAAARLGVEPADAVVFEDAEAGIMAGLAAGMRTVVVGGVECAAAEGLLRIRDYAGSRVEPGVPGVLRLTLGE